MSNENLAEDIVKLLQPTLKDVARKEVGIRMNDLPDIVRQQMDACIDGKCDVIAEKVAEKIPAHNTQKKITLIERQKLEGDPELVLHSHDSNEDLAKIVQDAIANSKPTITVEGHTAHDILDCPTCKPIIIQKLWQDEDYRKRIMESICDDDACRSSMIKMFEDKGLGVNKDVKTTETWAERRLRERRERKPQ